MKISNGLKQVIFKKLYEDLSHVEIIPYGKSIWFIDRKNEYWYFEYEKDGKLWWRYGFFQNFFDLFSLESDEFQPIISEWVEEVLKYKVESTSFTTRTRTIAVGQVLNYKVITPRRWDSTFQYSVEEVLNNNEDILETLPDSSKGKEEPNCGVETIRSSYFPCQKLMKRILKFINKH
jgi:hypothetical protein